MRKLSPRPLGRKASAGSRPGLDASPGLGSSDRRAGQQSQHHGARRKVLLQVVALGLLAALPAVAPPALAQPARIANEYDGKNHQPTPAEVSRADEQAGLKPPPAGGTDARTVDELDKQLLHDEAVDPPRNPASPVPVR